MATNYKYRINVTRLRRSLFGGNAHKIPPHCNDSWNDIELFNTRGESAGKFTIRVVPSSTIGCTKGNSYKGVPRNWKGTGKHRMLVQCPHCGYNSGRLIPAGRLGQHIAYKHPEV